jgi:hypothetical protein
MPANPNFSLGPSDLELLKEMSRRQRTTTLHINPILDRVPPRELEPPGTIFVAYVPSDISPVDTGCDYGDPDIPTACPGRGLVQVYRVDDALYRPGTGTGTDIGLAVTDPRFYAYNITGQTIKAGSFVVIVKDRFGSWVITAKSSSPDTVAVYPKVNTGYLIPGQTQSFFDGGSYIYSAQAVAFKVTGTDSNTGNSIVDVDLANTFGCYAWFPNLVAGHGTSLDLVNEPFKFYIGQKVTEEFTVNPLGTFPLYWCDRERMIIGFNQSNCVPTVNTNF